MKNRIKIIFLIALVFSLIVFTLSFLATLKTKSVITRWLEKSLGKKVSIADINIAFPLAVRIKDVKIEEFGSIKYMYISASILGFLAGKMAFNSIKIVSPEITYVNKVRPPVSPTAEEAKVTPAPTESKIPLNLRLIVYRLLIRDGKINLIDETAGEKGLVINIKDIALNVDNLYIFPKSTMTRFELSARIPWQQGAEEGKISAEGWLNLFKKDIQATLKIEGIDGVYLYPYYSKWVDLKKARIEKAKLNFTSDIVGLNNNITAICHLELTDIVRQARELDEPQERAEKIADAVLDIFRALNEGKIVLDFTIKTKMDYPQFGFEDIKTAVEDKVKLGMKDRGVKFDKVATLPANLIRDTARGLTNMFRAIIDSTIVVGRGLSHSIRGINKKEEPKKD